MILVGIMKNWDPVGLNKSIFGEGEGIEGGPAASMRMLIGGDFAGIGGRQSGQPCIPTPVFLTIVLPNKLSPVVSLVC